MPAGWDFIGALQRARERVAEAAGVSVEEVERAEGSHVSRARSYLEMAAPAMVRMQLALTIGTDPEESAR